MNSIQTHHTPTSISGRYLLEVPAGGESLPLLVGFHGYGQTAEDEMEILQRIPGVDNWIRCAIQALHPFYPRPKKIGACWMTSQDRELRIEENIRYVDRVVTRIRNENPTNQILIYHGFSQGTAMACRAAIGGEHSPRGVLLHGGDIPPELDDLDRMVRVLIARGQSDRIYRRERWESDLTRLGDSRLTTTRCEFDGGHEVSDTWLQAAGVFLCATL
jgi:predicted esterase